MSIEVDKSKLTQSLLKSISDHLSGRAECRGIEYIVIIDGEENKISFNPNVYVFPSRYERSKSDKSSVVSHVVAYHFPELLLEESFMIDTDKLVAGTYKYQCSYDNKRRRWVRIA